MGVMHPFHTARSASLHLLLYALVITVWLLVVRDLRSGVLFLAAFILGDIASEQYRARRRG